MKTVVWFGLVLGALSAAGRVIVTRSGNTATLDCQSYKRKLEWIRESESILVDGRYPVKGKSDIAVRSSVRQSNLVVSNVKPADAGLFTCKADGDVIKHKLVVVSVSASPSGELQPGNKVTLECQVNGMSPGPSIQWKAPNGRLLTGSTQAVESVALSDGGPWECMFSHGGKTENHTLVIMVKEPVTTTTLSPTSKNNPKNQEQPATKGGSSAPGPLLGLSWWMWVVIGVGCLVVVLLMVLVIVLCKRIKRRKRKLQTMKNGRQLLTPRQYCQCNRPAAAAKPQQGRRREKPSVLPLQPLLME